MKRKVVTSSLEMDSAAQHRPARPEGADFEVRRCPVPCPELNRFFYTAIGGDWFWVDRLTWDYERWLEWLDRPEVETWIGYEAGAPAGYFELEVQAEGSVEIAYFGLLSQFTGRGLGSRLLSCAIERAWEIEGTRRVWVHTCTLDHPKALANYVSRGFRQFKEETADVELPERSPGPWPGSRP